MIVIYSKKFYYSSRSFYATKNFIGDKYKTFFEEDLNKKKIDYINKNYKCILIFPKVDLDRVLLTKVRAKLIVFADHPFSKNYKGFLKKYKKYIKNKKIYFETYKKFKNFVPNYIVFKRRNKWKTSISNQESKKKYDIIFISGKSKIYLFDLVFNFFIIILAFLKRNKKFPTLLEIKKSYLSRLLFNLSFSDIYHKYSVFYQTVRYFKRKQVKQELEKIDNSKIIFSGSDQFLPKNYSKKFDWLDGKKIIDNIKKTKFIVIADNLTYNLNERLFFIKHGCIPIIQDDFLRKKELKDFTFNNKTSLLNVILNLNKKKKKNLKKKLINIIKLYNQGAIKNPYKYYSKQLKFKKKELKFDFIQ